jgi:TonB family protein
MKRLFAKMAFIGLLCFGSAASAFSIGVSFAYVDSRTVVTAEFSTSKRATVNIFNLTDYVVAFKAQDLWVIGEDNVLGMGQVFVSEEDKASEEPYTATVFLKPWSFQGAELLGIYPKVESIAQVILVLGGKRLYLAKSAPGEFEELAARIEALDMKKRDGMQMLQLASITPRGRIRYPTGEQDELDQSVRKILGPEEINPPRVLERKPIQPTPEAEKAGIYGRIRISIALSRFGEIKDAKVVRGLGYGLDERAIAVVKNSWKFLPATKNSELVDVTMTIEVEVPSVPKGLSLNN